MSFQSSTPFQSTEPFQSPEPFQSEEPFSSGEFQVSERLAQHSVVCDAEDEE